MDTDPEKSVWKSHKEGRWERSSQGEPRMDVRESHLVTVPTPSRFPRHQVEKQVSPPFFWDLLVYCQEYALSVLMWVSSGDSTGLMRTQPSSYKPAWKRPGNKSALREVHERWPCPLPSLPACTLLHVPHPNRAYHTHGKHANVLLRGPGPQQWHGMSVVAGSRPGTSHCQRTTPGLAARRYGFKECSIFHEFLALGQEVSLFP